MNRSTKTRYVIFQILVEIFKKNKSFTISNLIIDAESKWIERAKELQNINLDRN